MRILLFFFLLVLAGCDNTPAIQTLNVSDALGGSEVAGYERAIEPRSFSFPRDHGVHSGFRNEWWYFTGNVFTSAGRRFGYQVTFFRSAISPEEANRSSGWATRQVWMAHVALTDVDNSQHLEEERWARGAAGLAGVKLEPFKVWLEDWQVVLESSADFPWKLQIQSEAFSLALDLQPLKPVVLQGDSGLSRKSDEAGQASYYYSFSRLQTKGTIQVNGERLQVSGLSWLDREWSTSVLADNQIGWDWFSLQLDDGRDLMFYRLREKENRAGKNQSGSLIDAAGNKKPLVKGDVQLQEERYWQAQDGRRYPVGWRLQVPEQGIDWTISAIIDDQQMNTSVRYWEGAVDIYDRGSNKLKGHGYLEMTGY